MKCRNQRAVKSGLFLDLLCDIVSQFCKGAMLSKIEYKTLMISIFLKRNLSVKRNFPNPLSKTNRTKLTSSFSFHDHYFLRS